jgi:hypothetical protein
MAHSPSGQRPIAFSGIANTVFSVTTLGGGREHGGRAQVGTLGTPAGAAGRSAAGPGRGPWGARTLRGCGARRGSWGRAHPPVARVAGEPEAEAHPDAVAQRDDRQPRGQARHQQHRRVLGLAGRGGGRGKGGRWEVRGGRAQLEAGTRRDPPLRSAAALASGAADLEHAVDVVALRRRAVVGRRQHRGARRLDVAACVCGGGGGRAGGVGGERRRGFRRGLPLGLRGSAKAQHRLPAPEARALPRQSLPPRLHPRTCAEGARGGGRVEEDG